MLHRTNMATAETGHRSACQPEASPMEAGDRGGGIRKRFFAADAWASQSSFSATCLVTPPECIRHGNLVCTPRTLLPTGSGRLQTSLRRLTHLRSREGSGLERPIDLLC